MLILSKMPSLPFAPNRSHATLNSMKVSTKLPKLKKSMTKSGIDPIDAVLRDIRAGKPIIVVDDAERENEGDLVLAAEKATAKSVNFMMRYGRGLICTPITNERAARLGL